MNMYQQIFDILKEAIFGAEAVLSNSQSFVLDQIAIFGSVAVVLIPVVSMVAVACRLLRW